MFSSLRRWLSNPLFIQDSANKEPEKGAAPVVDPLDPIQKIKGWTVQDINSVTLRPISDFPVYAGYDDEIPPTVKKSIADKVEKLHKGHVILDSRKTAMDDCGMQMGTMFSPYNVPSALQSWYMSQSFIGYQACALIAQHWLVDKACSMAGEDAARNGWEIKARGNGELKKSDHDLLREADVKYRVKDNLIELNRFKNIFGIRVVIFQVKSDDPDYYEKPFNLDGVSEGSYEGMSQVDPYWMTPMLTARSTANPAKMGFYDPEYWIIDGIKYHRSHLIIARGPQPADILKPTYIFGGVPLVQRIYERVYCAERTANEAPLLSMSKRTMAVHVDMDKVLADQSSFEERLMMWIKYRDNHGVKVLGKEEVLEQFDVSLADFDSVIMNQYQLVAAIARVPSTKLLGTSPKGFNATGEFESVSYHEELESTQEHIMMPLLERHYDILGRSEGINVPVVVVCNSVDSITTQQRADLNDKKATTGVALINAGVISPDEERTRLRDDEHSGYNRLTDESAEEKPGMSPENIAEFEKAGAQEEKGQASELAAGAPGAKKPPSAAPHVGAEEQALPPSSGNSPIDVSNPLLQPLLLLLLKGLATMVPEGQDIAPYAPPIQGTHPGIAPTARGHVGGITQVVPSMPQNKLPKMKLGGMVLAIENPRGTIRKGVDMNGQWSVNMPHHYGFIKQTMGADGDEVDCLVGPNLQSDRVFVINQNDPNTGEFDEHKCMLGFDTEAQAVEAYHATYGRDWGGFDSVVPLSMDQLKAWVYNQEATQAPLGSGIAGGIGTMPTQNSLQSIDEAKWEEGKHPRAENGQFGSGGGGAAPAKKSEPAAGAMKLNVSTSGPKNTVLPNIAKAMTEASGGKHPSPEAFHTQVTSMGIDINPAQSAKYLKMFTKAPKTVEAPAAAPSSLSELWASIPKEEKEAATSAAAKEALAKEAAAKEVMKSYSEPEKPKVEHGYINPSGSSEGSGTIAEAKAKWEKTKTENTSKASEAATANGYKSEGVYNGISYFKDADGKKVSYKPDTDSWAVIEGGKLTQQGTGVASMEAYVKENKGAEPKPGTMAAAPVSVSHTSTAKAKSYGDVMSHEQQSFAKSGIANETALPSAVKKSILAYKGSDYQEINNAMRYNESFDPSKMDATTMAHILNLNRAFAMVAPSKNDVTVGRKVGLEALRTMCKDAGVGDLDHLTPGTVLRDPGIVSTSHSKDVWHGEVRFEIKVPKGSKAIDISETIKKNQSEQEVLLGPDSKLKITSVKKGTEYGPDSKHKYHIVCELVQ